ncbi:hypothetical protein F4815DRAFT_498801 [Daldinia loculata]|nr:hypothetical protein F4815DRAFT_498801 [Daldinia loculata]
MRNRKHLRHELLGTLALTGNGIDFTWRNLLRLSETPWLRDHKHATSKRFWDQAPEQIAELISDHGIIITRKSDAAVSELKTAGFDVLEMEGEFLATMSPENMNRLRVITNTATDLLCFTSANMLGNASDPNLTLSSGLSRALMLEQPTLRYSVLDIGPLQQLNFTTACENALKALVAKYYKDDCEFIEKDGLLHISRYGPDFQVNSLFRQRLGHARLSIDRVGMMDTLYFQQLSEPGQGATPPADYVDTEVRAVSLNAKDVYAMSGRVDTRDRTIAFDFSGVVTAIGRDIKHIKVDDRVVAYAPHHLGTAVRAPAGSVHKMLDDEEFTVVAPATYASVFSAEKVYLLVECLGGLGRSLSRWMITRGDRHFVFLGRSGADKPSAKQLVSRLEEAGATVGIVRGDISKAADVTAAVSTCMATGRRIGGFIQAAMVHVEKDAQNEPDFFLLTSSVSGTVGTATESNYCSANGFLDAFARWRRSRGQACVSVGLGMISEVGYLHENPEIEALLLRKGIQPLNGEEFLQIIDLALASEEACRPEESHLLKGLEPAAIRELSARGFDVTSHGVLVEARASVLLASLLAEKEAASTRTCLWLYRLLLRVMSSPWYVTTTE